MYYVSVKSDAIYNPEFLINAIVKVESGCILFACSWRTFSNDRLKDWSKDGFLETYRLVVFFV